jgi:branched-chain amino acid transport system ATP-binding protein
MPSGQNPASRQMALRVAGLRAGYHGGTVLHDINLHAAPGKVHVLLGGNGAGKTTLIHAIAGIGQVQHHGGRILLDDADTTRDVSGWPPHRRARSGMALVPQGRRVFGTLTVAEHFTLLSGAAHPARTWSGDWLAAAFPPLIRRLDTPARHLSGGEQQMLAIARALLCQPRLLLLDEPTEGLSPPIAQRVRSDVLDRLTAAGVSVLLATPDLDLARAVAADVTVLTAGRVSARFDRARLRADPTHLLTALTPVTPQPPTATAGPTTGLAASPDLDPGAQR